jgi:hypothetical protein
MEAEYVCQNREIRFPVARLIKDTSCKIATFLEGQVAIMKILVKSIICLICLNTLEPFTHYLLNVIFRKTGLSNHQLFLSQIW